MATMMALWAHARGGPEQLVCEQAPAPSGGPGEVLIAVHAAAITFAELKPHLQLGQPRRPDRRRCRSHRRHLNQRNPSDGTSQRAAANG